jgi:HEAT repeat protein
VFLTPSDYPSTPVQGLLQEVARGRVPLDHGLIRHLETRRTEAATAIQAFGLGSDEGWRFNVDEDLIALARHLGDPAALPYLISLLQDEEPLDGVFDAIAVLGEAAIEPLLGAYSEADDAATKSNVAFALAALGKEDPRVDAIVAAQEDDTARELYAERATPSEDPFSIWEEYPASGLPVAEALTIDERFELLESPLEDYRILGAASLFHEEFAAKGQDALLAKAQSDPSPAVRAHCWQALDHALEREEIVEAMIARLGEDGVTAEEKGGLLVALHPLADRPEINSEIREAYEQPETRLKALEAMWRSLEPEFSSYFPKHLDDGDVDIRRVALRGTGTSGQTGEMGRVRKMLNDADVREDALFAFAMISPGKPTAAFLRQVYRKLETEAGGFTEEEEEVVRIALDERLRAAGKPAVFSAGQNISAEE